jgi:hypothetical protein
MISNTWPETSHPILKGKTVIKLIYAISKRAETMFFVSTFL